MGEGKALSMCESRHSLEDLVAPVGSLVTRPIVTLENHGSTPTAAWPCKKWQWILLAKAMSFPLSASTTVSFTGPVHLHGWLCHSFSGQTGSGLFLKSRARWDLFFFWGDRWPERQFSSMLVLVGRVTSATSFDPTYAAIIQNKARFRVWELLGLPLSNGHEL